MRQGPDTLARIPKAVAQQKAAQLLADFALGVDGILSAADQIPHGFVIFPRHINRRQFPGAVQTSQIASITPVGLDAIPTAFGDHGGCDNIALKPLGSQMPIDLITAWPRFVDEAQLGSGCLQFANHFVQ